MINKYFFSKKHLLIKSSIMFLVVFLILSISCININSLNELNNDPYNTYTVGLKGELVVSPLAYEGTNVMNLNLKDPTDIYIDKEDNVYIPDKGNKVLYVYNTKTKNTKQIGSNILDAPMGVCVGTDSDIYVTDNNQKCVFRFKQDGTLVRKYERPTEVLFGEQSQFLPSKIVCDRNGNLFICSVGNANGIIQLNNDGEFMGYFGPNNVNLTLKLFFKRLMLSKEDRETYASLSPKVTSNLAIDNKNIIYTVIDGETDVSMKKYNISGTNVLNKADYFSSTYQDIWVDNNGFIYAVDNSSTGVIQVMTPEGTLLFEFGSSNVGSVLIGQFEKAAGIAVDSNFNIWVLDGTGKNIQVFRRTAFANTVTNAILYYNEGEYEKAREAYEETIRQNVSFVNAYVGLGKIYQREQNFDMALEYFDIANYKSGYSEVFWELRNDFLESNLLFIFIVIIIIVVFGIFGLWRKLAHLLFERVLHLNLYKLGSNIKNNRFYKEIKLLFLMFKKPKDVFDDIKFGLKIRKRTALILFGFFIIINIFGDYFIRGYLFRSAYSDSMNFAFELLKWGILIILFVIGNYLISSLQCGEGFFRDIFIGSIYSLAPIIIFKLPVDLLSNILTYNEGYVYDMLNGILWAWSIFNLILMIKEIHNYTIKELIVNVLLTFVAVVILVLLFLVIYILVMQLIDFIIGLISEGAYRT